jgi:putative acetyltransferase
LKVRAEVPGDALAIRALLLQAFPTPAEADLVERLRTDGDAIFSLVASEGDRLIGHAIFSRMQMPARSLGLGPVAVAAERRQTGVAEALIREGLQRARQQCWRAVFVLGGDYYRRFGFDPTLAAGFTTKYAGPHLMALALDPQWVSSQQHLTYAAAFADLD